ncbi:MAG: hypothetical protein WB983_00685, partial [Terriglobales bacterium]
VQANQLSVKPTIDKPVIDKLVIHKPVVDKLGTDKSARSAISFRCGLDHQVHADTWPRLGEP